MPGMGEAADPLRVDAPRTSARCVAKQNRPAMCWRTVTFVSLVE
jgi:hypothetical protein